MSDENGFSSEFDEEVARLERLLAGATREEDALRTQLTAVTVRRKRISRAMSALTGAAQRPGRPPTRTAAPKGSHPVSAERLERVKGWVREIAADRDEFRPIDIRSRYGVNSGDASKAFEQLRQEGFIRLARKAGNSKYFRLTPAALRDEANG